ncbi:hypothetical protein CD31A_1817 [Corynebacterium diphtheriae 31A]|nr:hypothetical protein CD31A_1817 [Corynebacterium diphtheriae 31A]
MGEEPDFYWDYALGVAVGTYAFTVAVFYWYPTGSECKTAAIAADSCTIAAVWSPFAVNPWHCVRRYLSVLEHLQRPMEWRGSGRDRGGRCLLVNQASFPAILAEVANVLNLECERSAFSEASLWGE